MFHSLLKGLCLSAEVPHRHCLSLVGGASPRVASQTDRFTDTKKVVFDNCKRTSISICEFDFAIRRISKLLRALRFLLTANLINDDNQIAGHGIGDRNQPLRLAINQEQDP